jgi:REP element-mobilizing transposase RayT
MQCVPTGSAEVSTKCVISICMHAVLFVAQGRKPFDDSLIVEAASFVRTVLAYKGVRCMDVCMQADHVHLLVQVPEQVDVYAALQTLRYWLQDFVERNSTQPSFEWDARYWLVSKSPADVESVRKYFRRQQAYHAQHSIEQEWADLMDLEEIG